MSITLNMGVAAGTVLIRRAGEGLRFRGEDNFLFGETYLATNSLIHKEFLT